MEDDIADGCRRMKLLAEQEEVAVFDEPIPQEKVEEIALSLMGKLLTKEEFSQRTMKMVLTNSWRPGKGLVIREFDKNLFLFQFFTKKDRDYVLNKGPWSFDGHILVVREWDGSEQPSELEFNKVRFWIKAYDVPGARQTETFASFLGSQIGRFISCEKDSMAGADKAMCFKAEIDVRKPLKAGVKVLLNGKVVIILIRYVKLPDFCYGCGRLGHSIKGCDEVDPDTSDEALPYV